jgi:hypothetical protein
MIPPRRYDQKTNMFSRGETMFGAPVCSGMIALANPENRGVVKSSRPVGYTLPEVHRLLVRLVSAAAHAAEHVGNWSTRRRRRQHQARVCHDRR